MKTYYLTILALAAAVLFSCKKDVNCDDAEICIRNTTSDTVWYSWGSSFYTDYITPGGLGCRNVGEIHINYGPFVNSSSTEVTYFNSSRGDFAIEVDECYEEREI